MKRKGEREARVGKVIWRGLKGSLVNRGRQKEGAKGRERGIANGNNNEKMGKREITKRGKVRGRWLRERIGRHERLMGTKVEIWKKGKTM